MSSDDGGSGAGPPPASARPAPSTALLLLAAALVIAVVVGVLLFGIDRPPALPALADDPDPAPAAGLAWTEWRDGETCLRVARPDGTVAAVRCAASGGELLGWTDDGLLVAQVGAADRILVVDPRTGAVRGTRRTEGRIEPPRPDDQAVTSYTDGGSLVVELHGREVWRATAPDSYGVQRSSVSPGGRFIAMIDTAERLLIVPADGSSTPRVWAEDVGSPAAVVWEGVDPQDRARTALGEGGRSNQLSPLLPLSGAVPFRRQVSLAFTAGDALACAGCDLR